MEGSRGRLFAAIFFLVVSPRLGTGRVNGFDYSMDLTITKRQFCPAVSEDLSDLQ
jgi:hypothetical protein